MNTPATIASSSALNLNVGNTVLALRSDADGTTFSTVGTTTIGSTVSINVNNLTAGTSNKTINLGPITMNTNAGVVGINATGTGNGYTLGIGAITVLGTTNMFINPQTANLNIASIAANGQDPLSLGQALVAGQGMGTIGAITGTVGSSVGTGLRILANTWNFTGASTYTGVTSIGGGVSTLIACTLNLGPHASLGATTATINAGAWDWNLQSGCADQHQQIESESEQQRR